MLYNYEDILSINSLFANGEREILLIEVWSHVLYARYKTGRNSFLKKPDGLRAAVGSILVDTSKGIKHVKSIINKFHPDKSKSKNSDSICRALIKWKEVYSELELRSGTSGPNSFMVSLRSELSSGNNPIAGIHFTIREENRLSDGSVWIERDSSTVKPPF